jgi:transglutaminase-like putative cysteine protease
MADLVRESIPQPELRTQAIDILRDSNAATPPEMAIAIASWVRSHYRYVNEPQEIILEPMASLREIREQGDFFGDCDDVVTFLGSLLTQVGIPVRFVAIRTGNREDHVFLEADIERVPGVWRAFDLTLPEGETIELEGLGRIAVVNV